MITLSDLANFLDGYLYFDRSLDLSKIDPKMSNGVMVKGKMEIRKIGFSVSTSLALFEIAREDLYDAVIVHHTFLLPPWNRFDQIYFDRLSFLIKNNISLFGYHFLLDAHPEIGNNAMILRTIGAKPSAPYLHNGYPWGWIGETEQSVTLQSIKDVLGPSFSTRTKIYDFGTNRIKRIVACSGMGAPTDMQYLIDNHIDLYITGEVHEWNRELFREAKINFIAGGHFATEVFGVKALMEKVAEKFPDVECGWIDLINDV